LSVGLFLDASMFRDYLTIYFCSTLTVLDNPT